MAKNERKIDLAGLALKALGKQESCTHKTVKQVAAPGMTMIICADCRKVIE